MRKPSIGDIVKLVGTQVEPWEGEAFRVYAVYDRIDVWWDTATGENKVALLDALDVYGREKASTAEWYVEVESVESDGVTLAVASFEVIQDAGS